MPGGQKVDTTLFCFSAPKHTESNTQIKLQKSFIVSCRPFVGRTSGPLGVFFRGLSDCEHRPPRVCRPQLGPSDNGSTINKNAAAVIIGNPLYVGASQFGSRRQGEDPCGEFALLGLQLRRHNLSTPPPPLNAAALSMRPLLAPKVLRNHPWKAACGLERARQFASTACTR